MTKRGLATFLWFLVGWSGGGMLAEFMALPSMLAVIPGVLIALLIHWDPTHTLWTRPVAAPRRVVRSINEVAAELDGQAVGIGAEQPTVR